MLGVVWLSVSMTHAIRDLLPGEPDDKGTCSLSTCQTDAISSMSPSPLKDTIPAMEVPSSALLEGQPKSERPKTMSSIDEAIMRAEAEAAEAKTLLDRATKRAKEYPVAAAPDPVPASPDPVPWCDLTAYGEQFTWCRAVRDNQNTEGDIKCLYQDGSKDRWKECKLRHFQKGDEPKRHPRMPVAAAHFGDTVDRFGFMGALSALWNASVRHDVWHAIEHGDWYILDQHDCGCETGTGGLTFEYSHTAKKSDSSTEHQEVIDAYANCRCGDPKGKYFSNFPETLPHKLVDSCEVAFALLDTCPRDRMDYLCSCKWDREVDDWLDAGAEEKNAAEMLAQNTPAPFVSADLGFYDTGYRLQCVCQRLLEDTPPGGRLHKDGLPAEELPEDGEAAEGDVGGEEEAE